MDRLAFGAIARAAPAPSAASHPRRALPVMVSHKEAQMKSPMRSVLLLSAFVGLALSLLVGCGGDNPVEPKATASHGPVTFDMETSLFQSAEILEPWGEDPTLRVILPDQTVLYRQLRTNHTWKEPADASKGVQATLTAEEERLVSAFDLDTGWFPSNSPIQFRFVFRASEGRIRAQMTGDMTVHGEYTKDSFNGSVGWVGDPDGGDLHLDAGVEMTGRVRVNVDAPWPLDDFHYEGNLPQSLFPSQNLMVDKNTPFTPFLLGDQTVECGGDIPGLTAPSMNIYGIDPLTLDYGMGLWGACNSTLEGDSLSYSLNDQCGCVISADDEASVAFAIEGAQTTLSPTVSYDGTGSIRYDLYLEPFAEIHLDLGVWEYSHRLAPARMTVPVIYVEKRLHAECTPTITLATP